MLFIRTVELHWLWLSAVDMLKQENNRLSCSTTNSGKGTKARTFLRQSLKSLLICSY